MPTVTIVLPTYNGEKYIRHSINSILEQSYEDWELIVVDDCSIDNTLEIILEYEKIDRRISVIHNNVNMNLPASLNIGFRYAKGRYLTWTSDDNIYMPKALTVMIERLEATNCAMVCADMDIIDEDGKIQQGLVSKYKDEELCRRNTVGACFMYRREVLDNVGYYDTELFYVEDYDYWLRIKKRYGKIERIDQILYKFRYHEKSLSFSKMKNVQLALYKLRKKHFDFILGNLGEEKEILASLYYEMLEMQCIDTEMIRKFQEYLPEIVSDLPGSHGKYIIFGAGKYGRMALDKLEDKANFFADNDFRKIGDHINGKEILSYDRMISLVDQYDVMIAVHGDKIYSIICQLLKSGVSSYCSLQMYNFRTFSDM